MKKNLLINIILSIFTITVLFISISVNHVFAADGWTAQTGIPNRRWTSLASSSDGSTLVAVYWAERDSDGGYAYISKDYGNYWEKIYSLGRGYWESVTMSNDGQKIIITDTAHNNYISNDSGNTWKQEVFNGFTGYGSAGSTIIFNDLGNIVKIDDNLYKLNNNNEYDLVYNTLNDINYLYTDDGENFVGYNGNNFFTSNNSSFWTQMGTEPFHSSLFININNESSFFSIDNGGNLYKTSNYGESWVKISSIESTSWIVSFVSSYDGSKLAAIEYDGYIYTSFDSGVTWTKQTGAGQRAWNSITSSADGTKLAAGVNGGYIYTSIDSGATWTEATSSGQRKWLSIASSADGSKLAAVDGNNGNGYIYTSTDSGITWTEQTTIGQKTWLGTTLSSDGTRWVAIGGGYLYTSIDFGVNWTEQKMEGNTSRVFFTDNSKLIVLADNYIYISSDLGITWSIKNLPINPLFNPKYPTINDDNIKTILHGVYDSSTLLYTSSDLGKTWIKEKDISNEYLTHIVSSTDGSKLAALGGSGYIYTSDDSGVIWTEQTGAGQRAWNSITSSADGTKLAAIEQNGYIYMSNDSGLTWTEQTDLGQHPWTGITSSFDGSKLAVIEDMGNIYTYGSLKNPVIINLITTVSSSSIVLNEFINLDHTIHGFEYCSSGISTSSCTYDNTISITSATNTVFNLGNYTATATNLIPNSYYHVRAFADDGNNVYYSDDYTVLMTYQDWNENLNSGLNYYWKQIVSSSNGSKLFGTYCDNNDICHLYKSFDYGITWEEVNSGAIFPSYLTLSSDNTNLAVTDSSGYIYTSSDFGNTWTEQTGAGQHYWTSITSSADGSKLAAVDGNYGYIYTSNDSGLTWTEQTSSGQRNWSSVSSSADGSKLLATEFGGYIYMSDNFGKSWKSVPSLGERAWSSSAESANGKIMVVSNGGDIYSDSIYEKSGYIYISLDYGETWVPKFTAGSRNWSSVTISKDGSKIIATDGNNGYVYISTNYGDSWILQTSPGQQKWKTSTNSDSGEYIYAAGEGVNIWSYHNFVPQAKNVRIKENN